MSLTYFVGDVVGGGGGGYLRGGMQVSLGGRNRAWWGECHHGLADGCCCLLAERLRGSSSGLCMDGHSGNLLVRYRVAVGNRSVMAALVCVRTS